MKFWSRLLGAKVIRSPRLGILNLLGSPAAPLIAEDRAAFGELFASVEEDQNSPPLCDVLFIYCNVEATGRCRGPTRGFET